MKLLCLLWLCSVWLGVHPSLIEMPRERLCCNVLGEDVGRILTVLILRIRTTSLSASCWIKRCFNPMCFAVFEYPIRVAMLFPLEESV